MSEPFRLVPAPDRECWYRAVSVIEPAPSEPMAGERLGEIELLAYKVLTRIEGGPVPASERRAFDASIPDLIAEVRRLRAELAICDTECRTPEHAPGRHDGT